MNNNIEYLDIENNDPIIDEKKDQTIQSNDYSNRPVEENDFVKSLPEWDLVPPYETVRRVIRQ